MSLTPEIKMDVLLGRSPAGLQALDTWVFAVVPSGVPLRGLDVSLDNSIPNSQHKEEMI